MEKSRAFFNSKTWNLISYSKFEIQIEMKNPCTSLQCEFSNKKTTYFQIYRK